jgi:hypothetical protein
MNDVKTADADMQAQPACVVEYAAPFCRWTYDSAEKPVAPKAHSKWGAHLLTEVSVPDSVWPLALMCLNTGFTGLFSMAISKLRLTDEETPSPSPRRSYGLDFRR